jgi:hypothetical protein
MIAPSIRGCNARAVRLSGIREYGRERGRKGVKMGISKS